MRLAQKELAILAIAISLRGNPFITSSSIDLIITYSLAVVRFYKLAIVLEHKGCLVYYLLSVCRGALKIAIVYYRERVTSYLKA